MVLGCHTIRVTRDMEGSYGVGGDGRVWVVFRNAGGGGSGVRGNEGIYRGVEGECDGAG